MISRKVEVVILTVVLLIGTLYYVSSATGAQYQYQSISVLQTQTQTAVYCVYQVQFLVVEVQVTPAMTGAGAQLGVVFTVEYLDSSPVKLNPEQASFLLLGVGSDYSHTYPGTPVTPTGNPGQYSTSIALPSDIPLGTYKLYCIHCTLTDGAGNYSPNSDISSDETAMTTDSSLLDIGVVATTSTTTTTTGGIISPSLLAGLALLILIVALLIVLMLRRPRKKTEQPGAPTQSAT